MIAFFSRDFGRNGPSSGVARGDSVARAPYLGVGQPYCPQEEGLADPGGLPWKKTRASSPKKVRSRRAPVKGRLLPAGREGRRWLLEQGKEGLRVGPHRILTPISLSRERMVLWETLMILAMLRAESPSS